MYQKLPLTLAILSGIIFGCTFYLGTKNIWNEKKHREYSLRSTIIITINIILLHIIYNL